MDDERRFNEEWAMPRTRLERGGFVTKKIRTHKFEHVRHFGIVLERLVFNWILEVYLWRWQLTWVIGKTARVDGRKQ